MINSVNKEKYLVEKIIAGSVIAAGIFLSLFAHWEPTAESWGYWMFARIFSETGKFIIIERSPLYVLYLNLFRWIGYPNSVTVEYVATSLILISSVVVLFRRYIGLFWSSFAITLWIPFLQISEPPVQKLALACLCFAVIARGSNSDRFRRALSYALLICAYLFRNTYILALLIFAIWDIAAVYRQRKIKNPLRTLRPKVKDWPIWVMLVLIIWFSGAQSPHRWNNAWCTSSNWFPNDGKTLSHSSFIQTYNRKYILRQYGSFKDRDFYFTNKELFGGANTIPSAIVANPVSVARGLWQNTINASRNISRLTMGPSLFYANASHIGGAHYLMFFIGTIPFVLFILYGAFRACKDTNMVLFVVINICLVGSTFLSMPKVRYMVQFIPVFILSAYWYGQNIRKLLPRSKFVSRVAGTIIMCASFIFFSPQAAGPRTPNWKTVKNDLMGDVESGDIRVMEKRSYSYKASYDQMKTLVVGCRGIMSLESRFMGAFLDIPINRIYDIWEIPPFGSFRDATYDGLTPDRIDRVLVSSKLASNIGGATNIQMRYQNYIKPYVLFLRKKGARIHDIDNFGQVTVLPEEIRREK